MSTLTGLPASPGAAVGPARVLDALKVPPPNACTPAAERPAEAARAVAALDEAAEAVHAVAAGLRDEGRDSEAEVVETGVLMALDPGLRASVERLVLDEGAAAGVALVRATEEAAAAIAAIDDETLAARADDVRSLGRRAARALEGGEQEDGREGVVLVAASLGPADVAELGDGVLGIALAAGGVTAHAAIVARSLGIPMVVGLGPDILAAAPGAALVVDGSAGTVDLHPTSNALDTARRRAGARAHQEERAYAERELPAVTADGHRVRVLANVASAAEVSAALRRGAEGAGLVRTELAFLEASGWPSEEEHRRALTRVLGPLRGRTATVRVLDFGADKTPPFLAGTEARGIELLLGAPEALAAQLRAIVLAGADTRLRVLLPLVEDPAQVEAVRVLVPDGTALGAMIETPAAARRVEAIAAVSDFLSVGTNDLTASTLGADRFGPDGAVTAHHPEVLRHVAATVAAAHAAGIVAEVCGEAASDPVCAPLLVGLGVDELSVGAARVGTVRGWIRALRHDAAAALAARALAATDAAEVAAVAADTAARLEPAAGVA